MKLLQVISSVNPKGGGPIESIRQFSLSLMRLEVQVEVVCCDLPTSPWIMDFQLCPVIALGPSRFGYAYSAKLLPWLKSNARNYDIVIVNGIWQYASFAVWRALASSSVPYVVFAHGMLDPWFKKQYPLKHLKKWLYWPWAEYRVLRDARAVIFTCEEERLLARKSFSLYQVKEAVTAFGTSKPPQNADQLRFLFLKKYPQLLNRRLVLFLGRLQEKKGCDILIEAFAETAANFPEMHLVMAGPDSDNCGEHLRELGSRLGISDRISWLGMLQGELKWGAFYASEVFCLPSHQENFGIAIAEALGCGISVIISDKVNIWREIADGEAGLVGSDTLSGTVENLRKWMNFTRDERVLLSSNSRRVFEKHFLIENAAQNFVEILRNCLK